MTGEVTINLIDKILSLDETHTITGWSFNTKDNGNITFELGMILKEVKNDQC